MSNPLAVLNRMLGSAETLSISSFRVVEPSDNVPPRQNLGSKNKCLQEEAQPRLWGEASHLITACSQARFAWPRGCIYPYSAYACRFWWNMSWEQKKTAFQSQPAIEVQQFPNSTKDGSRFDLRLRIYSCQIDTPANSWSVVVDSAHWQSFSW